MSTIILLLASVLTVTATIHAAKYHAKPEKYPSCEQFTQGLTFNDNDALGTWYLLRYRTEMQIGAGDSNCLEFSSATNQDRKNIFNFVGKYVEGLDWETLTLKMKIPCSSANSNRTRDYFLEKVEGDGSYRILPVPPITAKLEFVDFQRYAMRLKLVEGQYLGMMDCHENNVFLFGKQPLRATDLDDHLKNIIDAYWSEDH